MELDHRIKYFRTRQLTASFSRTMFPPLTVGPLTDEIWSAFAPHSTESRKTPANVRHVRAKNRNTITVMSNSNEITRKKIKRFVAAALVEREDELE